MGMKTYYTEKRARSYNSTWRAFSSKTQANVLSLLENELRQNKRDCSLSRVLDVGCGTGTLLAYLAEMLPGANLYGIDGSELMLAQARHRLPTSVSLSCALLPTSSENPLPFARDFFDIVTCTNTLHYAKHTAIVFQSLHDILRPGGLLLIEDYTLRRSPFPWYAFEWAIKMYDPQHIRLYTSTEMQELAKHYNLSMVRSQAFRIDFFCDGWVLLLCK